MKNELLLRDVLPDDLPIFFEQQLDQEAMYMAAFTAKDPTDRDAFMAHWHKILEIDTCIIKTIIFNGQVAGSVSSYEEEGKPEVTYWLGREYWGKGIATWALKELLTHHSLKRPMDARVAKDNPGSRRVLEKCGFTIVGEERGFANARGQEIEELLLELKAIQ
jgi:RimJ/RimL family protein N-acetyltransferase